MPVKASKTVRFLSFSNLKGLLLAIVVAITLLLSFKTPVRAACADPNDFNCRCSNDPCCSGGQQCTGPGGFWWRNCSPPAQCLGSDPNAPPGGRCNGCGSGSNSIGTIKSLTITNNNTTPPSATVTVKIGGGGGCEGAGGSGTDVWLGTDYLAVSNNCDTFAPNTSWPNCYHKGWKDVGGSVSTVGWAPLEPNTVYYVKARIYVGFRDGSQAGCGVKPIPYLNSCSVTNEGSSNLSVGQTAVFKTNLVPGDNILDRTPWVTQYGITQVSQPDNCNRCTPAVSGFRIQGYWFGVGEGSQAYVTMTKTWNGVTMHYEGYQPVNGIFTSNGNYRGDYIWISWPTLRDNGTGFGTSNKYVGAGIDKWGPTWDITVTPDPNFKVPPLQKIQKVLYKNVSPPDYFHFITDSTYTNPDYTDPFEAKIFADLETPNTGTPLISDTYVATTSASIEGVLGCTSSTPVIIGQAAASLPWWQIGDSDIQSSGYLSSKIPADNFFGLAGAGGYPGVVAYGSTIDTALTSSNISNTAGAKWLANSEATGLKTYDYSFFANQVPSGTSINNLPSSGVISQTDIDSGVKDQSTGYYWYKYDGSGTGLDLSLNSNLSIGDKKIILLVNAANFNIAGNINGITRGQDFFMVVTGKDANGDKGNIVVDPTVGGGVGPNLEGIYFADGTFSTGLGTSQLKVRGIVVANSGINLQRDLGGESNATTPSEYFEFAPDQILLFPTKLGDRKIDWKEVAP